MVANTVPPPPPPARCVCQPGFSCMACYLARLPVPPGPPPPPPAPAPTRVPGPGIMAAPRSPSVVVRAAAAARWLWAALFGPFYPPQDASPDPILLEAMWEVDAMYPHTEPIAPRVDLRRLVPPDACAAGVRPSTPQFVRTERPGPSFTPEYIKPTSGRSASGRPFADTDRSPPPAPISAPSMPTDLATPPWLRPALYRGPLSPAELANVRQGHDYTNPHGECLTCRALETMDLALGQHRSQQDTPPKPEPRALRMVKG